MEGHHVSLLSLAGSAVSLGAAPPCTPAEIPLTSQRTWGLAWNANFHRTDEPSPIEVGHRSGQSWRSVCAWLLRSPQRHNCSLRPANDGKPGIRSQHRYHHLPRLSRPATTCAKPDWPRFATAASALQVTRPHASRIDINTVASTASFSDACLTAGKIYPASTAGNPAHLRLAPPSLAPSSSSSAKENCFLSLDSVTTRRTKR